MKAAWRSTPPTAPPSSRASKPLYAKFSEEVEGGQEMIDEAMSLAEGEGS